MGIDKFIYILISISVMTLFLNVDNNIKKIEKKEPPLMTFINSTLYTINKDSVNKIVKSKEFIKYKSAEVLRDGVIVTRIKDDKNKNITDTISANIIFKVGDNIELSKNVRYNRGTIVSLTTDELNYNTTTQIARNNVIFNGLYEQNKIKGTHLYLDTINGIMKSKDIHFDILNTKKKEIYEIN